MSALPPAPAGFSATQVVARAIPLGQRVGVALGVGVVYASLAGLMIWRGLAWYVAVAIFAVGFALTVAATFTAQLSAGKGWLRGGSHIVRTDALIEIRTQTTVSGARVLMRDADGRTLRVRAADLQVNPALWDLVRSDVAASLGNNLTIDAQTHRLFG